MQNDNERPPEDFNGLPFSVGDRVVRAMPSGAGSAELKYCIVTKIQNGKVYLDNSHVPMRYSRKSLMIIQKNAV